MRIYLALKNYRCFVRSVSVEIAPGFTAFVGVNNAGKSTIMRVFLEFRPLLSSLTNINALNNVLRGGILAAPLAHVLDNIEVFSNLSQDPIEFCVKFAYEENESSKLGGQREEEYRFTVSRAMQLRGALYVDGGWLAANTPNVAFGGNQILRHGRLFVSFETAASLFRSLSNTLYVGPF